MTKKLAIFALVFVLPSCSTVSQWSKSSMNWADRNMPTYDDLNFFGTSSSEMAANGSIEQEVGQLPALPPVDVAAQDLQQPAFQVPSGQQVIYKDAQVSAALSPQIKPEMQPEYYVDNSAMSTQQIMPDPYAGPLLFNKNNQYQAR